MKPLLAWAKKHWLIVLFSAITLISIPLAWFFSSSWNAKIRAEQEKKVAAEMSKVTQTKVTYQLPQFEPGVTPFTLSTEPTMAHTLWFQARTAELADQAKQAWARAEAFNKGTGPDAQQVGRKPHAPFLNGTFPGDGLNDGALGEILFKLEAVFLAKSNNPDVYTQLLESFGAGAGADAERLAETLTQTQIREQEKITAGKRELTEEEKVAMTKTLRDRRIAAYRAAAGQVHFFASKSVFNTNPKEGSAIPSKFVVELNSDRDDRGVQLLKYFVWQWDYWVMNDIFTAIKVANTDSSGRYQFVPDAVVKKVEQVLVKDPEGLFGSSEESNPYADASATTAAVVPTATVPGLAPLKPSVSITGREMGSWNPVYDVRRVELTCIVSSGRVNELVDAIQRTNFMTVTELDLSTVSEAEELSKGFDFGGEHVVRAQLKIETIWLRSWMQLWMPPKLRAALGIAEPTAVDGQAPTEAAPAPTTGG